MGTKNDPGEFDCYANAEPDEPMFVLLARDHRAPGLVRAWAWQHGSMAAWQHGSMAAWQHGVTDKEQEALDCARSMEEWRIYHHTPREGEWYFINQVTGETRYYDSPCRQVRADE